MRSSHSLEHLSVVCPDRHAVADAGLLLPATLAERLGLKELIDEHVHLGAAPGAANPGVKALTLIYSSLAGGECIDDAAALRAGATAAVLGGELRAPSTLGTFLRSFSWGHALQLDAVSRRLLARACGAGAGADSAPLTIDLDSTICETYGLQKAGGSKLTCAHVPGCHPLLAVAAGTGEVLHAPARRTGQHHPRRLHLRARG
ncbi:MAG TPA: transposase [Thermoleophilia bacterium]|nr:transposase [Thermoleophilia bacterium]